MHHKHLLGGLSVLAILAVTTAGAANAQQNYGGMMGPGMGPGMMGPGMMGNCGTMGPGMMNMMGLGMMGWGNGQQQVEINLSAGDVKSYLDRYVTMMGNPHIKTGAVTEKDANTITASIVTTDKDALVQRFSIDRHTGVWQPVQ